MESLPTILFFNNFPPSNLNGGAVLLRRLLSGYPSEKLIALTSSLDSVGPTNPPWCRRHVEFFTFDDDATWGIWRFRGLFNRIKAYLNWLLLPPVTWYATRLMRETSASAVVSIASGYYFLGAAAAARWMGVPWVLIVHDTWVPIVAEATHISERFFHRLYRWALRRADHVFVVSKGMQERLKADYGIDSEVQMPATEPWDLAPVSGDAGSNGSLRILYTGNGFAAGDSLMLLIRLIRAKTLQQYGLNAVELHLCIPWNIDADQGIKQHGWVSESETRRQIAAADVLFLPYSFEPKDDAVIRTSFPAKAADYIASGKAILVLGPKESTIGRYAHEHHFAELVTEPSEAMVAQAICRLASGEEYRRTLALNGQQAFAKNHNIFRQRERFGEVIRGLVSGSKR